MYVISSRCTLHRDHYFTQVIWRSRNTVMITWSNRVQNESISVIYNVAETVPTYNTVNCPSPLAFSDVRVYTRTRVHDTDDSYRLNVY